MLDAEKSQFYAVFDGQRQVLNILPPSSQKLGGAPAAGPAILRALLVLFHGNSEKNMYPKIPLWCTPGGVGSQKKYRSLRAPYLLTIFDFDNERASAGHWNSVPWAIGAPRHGMCIK